MADAGARGGAEPVLPALSPLAARRGAGGIVFGRVREDGELRLGGLRHAFINSFVLYLFSSHRSCQYDGFAEVPATRTTPAVPDLEK